MNALIEPGVRRRLKFPGKFPLGVTILEVVFAAAIVAFTLGAIYVTHWKTLQIIRQAHRSVNASQVLQEKAEALRALNWSNLTNSAFVSGSNCLGGPISTNERQIQSVNKLVETITISEYPAASPQPSPTAGYTITRTIAFPQSGGAPISTVAVGSSSPFPNNIAKIYGFLRVTWYLNAATDAAPYSRDFEMAVSNPPQ